MFALVWRLSVMLVLCNEALAMLVLVLIMCNKVRVKCVYLEGLGGMPPMKMFDFRLSEIALLG